MNKSMMIYDTRVAGEPPQFRVDKILKVDKTVSLANTLQDVAAFSDQVGGLDELIIVCHGIIRSMNARDQKCNNTVNGYGGFGLALCKEQLTLANTWDAVAIRGKMRKITIFSCATANVAPFNLNAVGDGMRFCGELALITQAEVIAATETQHFQVQSSYRNTPAGRVEVQSNVFEGWTGPVYRFTPDSPQGYKVAA